MAAIGSVTVVCPGCEEPITVPLQATVTRHSPDTLGVAINVDTSTVAEHKASAHPETQGT